MKPEKIGTVWTAVARIRYIDDATNKWVTVAKVIDTPNAIKAALVKAWTAHPTKILWVDSDTNGRDIPKRGAM